MFDVLSNIFYVRKPDFMGKNLGKMDLLLSNILWARNTKGDCDGYDVVDLHALRYKSCTVLK